MTFGLCNHELAAYTFSSRDTLLNKNHSIFILAMDWECVYIYNYININIYVHTYTCILYVRVYKSLFFFKNTDVLYIIISKPYPEVGANPRKLNCLIEFRLVSIWTQKKSKILTYTCKHHTALHGSVLLAGIGLY